MTWRWLLLIVWLGLPACSHAQTPAIKPLPAPVIESTALATAPPTVDARAEATIASTLSSMTVAQKIGQLLIVPSTSVDLNEDVGRFITATHAGNIVVLDSSGETPSQLRDELGQLQQVAQASNAGIPLLIGVDQEGGDISRLQQGFTLFPDAMALGAAGSADLAREQGRAMGEEMRATGINLDLAPVMDVNTNPDNPVIGLRSFGDRPPLVEQLGTAFIAGLHDAGVLATAKHFPGHGATSQDSHVTLPVVTEDQSTLEQVDLPPFQAALRAGVDAVLVAHVSYPALDPNRGVPASLSKPIVSGLLRGQLGFNGAVISDDLGMRAITDHYSLGEAAVQAILAGEDMVILTTPANETDTVVSALVSAVSSGRISEQRLNESVTRILRLKQRIAPPGDLSSVGDQAHEAVASAVSEQAVTAIAGNGQQLNASLLSGDRLLVVSPSFLPRAGTGTELGEDVRRRYAATEEIVVDPDSGAGRSAALAAAPGAAAVVVATSEGSAANDQFVRAMLAANPHSTVLLLELPYEARAFPSATSVMATLGDIPDQVEAAVAVVFGERPANGVMPVAINRAP